MTQGTSTTRRGFIAGGAAAAGAALVPTGAAEAASTASRRSRAARRRRVDVVVVGGGLAGLSAARRLVEDGKSVVVLEARDRVGGRTLNRKVGKGDAVVELGGEYVGPTQNYTIALAAELGVRQYPGYQKLDSVFINGSTVSRYNGPLPAAGSAGTADLLQLVGAIDDLAKQVPIEAPWTWSQAAEYDSQSAYTWVMNNSTANPALGVEIVDLFFDSAFGAKSTEVSMLYVLSQVAGFGDKDHVGTIVRGLSSQGGAQQDRFVGGSQLLSIRAAERLGRRVVLNAPVRRIDQTASGVTVVCDQGTYEAKRVVVAIPPQLATAIIWDPLLPAIQDAMRRRMTLGTLTKIHAVYPEPFWRKDPGVGMALKIGGVVPEMFDNTPHEGTPGVLLGFHGGHAWTKYAGHPGRRRAGALADFAQAFGKRALHPIDYFEQDWTTEQWSRGCPVSVVAPGVVTEFLPHLIVPFDRVHWAGTETATYWNGYMDGAISSGHRAAREVLTAL